jgi:hypothetical protein
MFQGWFRRSVFKTIRFLKHPRKLRQRPRCAGSRAIFSTSVSGGPRSTHFAGGMAVGMFITLQLLPIQMPTATILAPSSG